ncbi:hypothetical protein D9611_006873 [Ephemerocybe angulata]|uniref:Uncharacterized protein n=1 Tax=Ephemerocybe angulata TaxID=980116 RepID=A0A8H5AZT0_9AGAR|nr:hypothetical protein D9611_006873 [Tulosesus angulatus]
MPTSTAPFEVLFEFTNDTSDLATLQLTRDVGASSSSPSPSSNSSGPSLAGPMIRLFPRDSVSLVLDAGATYHYLVKQNQRKAQIS